MTRDAKDDKMNVMRFLMRKVDEWGWNFSRKERAVITRRVAEESCSERNA
jgi:hypothetical protein